MLPRDEEILGKLRQKGSRILSFRELVKTFQVRADDEDAFRASLDDLERRGEIARVPMPPTPMRPRVFPFSDVTSRGCQCFEPRTDGSCRAAARSIASTYSAIGSASTPFAAVHMRSRS